VNVVAGVHHVKVPVSDLVRSQRWYGEVLGLTLQLEFRDEDGEVRGIAFERRNGLTLCLRQLPPLAQALSGFDPLAVLVPTRRELDALTERLDRMGVAHGPVIRATLGWLLSVPDPDGIELRFYTEETHTA
jgi:catechol 2,3-dioxygenase-like lactoylglutathione lyase family enzyme